MPTVNQKHIYLKKLFSGTNKNFTVNIEDDEKYKVNKSAELDRTYKTIKTYFPDWKQLSKNIDDLSNDTVKVGSKNISTGKAVSFVMGKCTDTNKRRKYAYYKYVVLDGISRAIQQKKDLTVIKDNYKVKILFDDESFNKLGSYGPDRTSCFRTGGYHELDKGKLITELNSFVVLILKNNRVVGRCLGKYMRNHIFKLCNFYGLHSNIGTFAYCFCSALNQLEAFADKKVNISLLNRHKDRPFKEVYYNGKCLRIKFS